MLTESLEALAIVPNGYYVDATFGGGGHAAHIVAQLGGGKLIAFDQDSEAQANAAHFDLNKLLFVAANFRYLRKYLRLHKIEQVHGILADLGVSSHHFDTAERGFSIRGEGALDMRMNPQSSLSAFEVINNYEEEALSRVLWEYGEVRRARALAKAIVQRRSPQPIGTTQALLEVLRPFAPRGKEHKFFAQVFQAIRIEVNDELEALKSLLRDAVAVLPEGGRLVVISYHSLEDRLVKHFIKTGNFEGIPQKDMYGNLLRPLRPVINKALQASAEEVATNNRARSARLRIAERTNFSFETTDV